MTHTQRISGTTSQLPSARTPPHGPLRSVLGHVIGQVRPVECSTHCPHIWQPKTRPLTACSICSTAPMGYAGTPARLSWMSSLAFLTADDASAE